MATNPGLRIHRNRLARMRRIKTPALKALYEAGEVIRADAAASIKEGAISGPGHIPSQPFTAPNADTHRLDLSIDVVLNPSRLSASVVSRAPYSSFLEFGTSKMAARPFLRPALLRNRNRIIFGQVQAVNSLIGLRKGTAAQDQAVLSSISYTAVQRALTV